MWSGHPAAPRPGTGWPRSTSASSPPPPATWPPSAARSTSCPAARRPARSRRWTRTASSSPTAPVTRRHWATPSRPCAASCARACRSSASAWAARSWAARSAWRPTSCGSATGGSTSRCRTCAPAGSRSPATTTASRWPRRRRVKARRPAAAGSRPSSALRRSRTSTSTTASWRACACWTRRPSPCSTTRRRLPARTTPPACSRSSATSWRRGGMPKRADLKSVLVIGSGPIIIGQACEFDYSGTQACRVLREEGIRVSLVNSNPATIMTDPEFADATYVEPITQDVLEKVIAAERPDAVLPTLGGQTALNAAIGLHEAGTLTKYGVELIGADIEAITAGEDRKRFKEIVTGLGAEVPDSRVCHSIDECELAAAELGYPLVVRPSFTLGGSGSGIAYQEDDLRRMAGAGLDASPVTEVLLEESIIGWKEFELELMRDRADNVVVVCSIENIDPMGVHTGDSVTVAPAMTLTDREYQQMRDTAIDVLRAVGVDTGGCNIQFAVHPQTGRLVVIEMNPRVSRSSALASKATGFTLDEIRNDITGETPASFEPALDYVVVKVPRFAFEKFPGADPVLTTHMKSVGEAMAIGRSFPEALQKALRSLESPAAPFTWRQPPGDKAELLARCAAPHDGRLATVHQAIRAGATVAEVAAASSIDPWFIDQIAGIEDLAQLVVSSQPAGPELIAAAKAAGFSDDQLGQLTGADEAAIRRLRRELGIAPVYHTVDTCAAEFAARTPYLYSTYDQETEVPPGDRPKVIILGSGPNRIGQGIEFDYACVHASFALSAAGYETVMVNCNPETVSTDYDTSDRLYFEPLTLEDVLEVVR